MAEISIGAAVGEGFDLIRRRPLQVASWGLIQILFTGLAFALLSPVFMSSFGELARQAQTGNPQTSPAALQQMMQAQSAIFLFDFVSLFVNAVFYCAVFRAVIRPDQARFAYLRVGAAELFLGVLIIGMVFASLIGLFIAAIVIGLVVGLTAVLHAALLGGIVAVAAFIAALVGMAYVGLRLSLAGPMMVDDGKFHLTDAWALTRGKAASLFALALVVMLVLIAGEVVIGTVLVAVGLGVVSSAAGGLQNLPTFFQQSPGLVLGKLAPVLIVLAVVWVPLSGCFLAVTGAPWARAYRDLRPRRDIAETFA